MESSQTGANLPLDVSSRVEGLLALVSEIRQRVSAFTVPSDAVLPDLIDDFHEMAREYILLFEERLKQVDSISTREKWIRRHEMLDKLTREWHVIYSLSAARELGSSHLEKFMPYVDQASEDLGLSDDRKNSLLIPTFGENFSLVTLGYSRSDISILNLPISVIHSPWELSVIWHELAGLKVIRIRKQIKEFLEAYRQAQNVQQHIDPLQSGNDLVASLFRRIADGTPLDEEFIGKVKDFACGDGTIPGPQDEIWSQDWFEQLYEDACSVFAFGDEFVSVLEKILARQARKLAPDRKHPGLATRLQVARRLLALQAGDAPAPETAAERLTDELLWAFLSQKRSDAISALPVAYANPRDIPPVRTELIGFMKEFNQNFGDLSGGTINERHLDFSPMFAVAQKASMNQSAFVAEQGQAAGIRDKLLNIFRDADIRGLLEKPFSPSDEVNFSNHTGTQTWQNMYIDDSSHGGHTVLHYGH